MNAENFGTVKLYHPRGPLVTLPLPLDPEKAMAHVAHCIDVGWLVSPPGLEQGEQKDDVGYVLRGTCESNGEVTPTLLLYSTNESHSFSFLKVYLNTAADVAAFEFAAKAKLESIPEYVGNGKPERGKSPKLDRYIVRMGHPFGVIYRANPKYNEMESAAARGRGEIYKVPRRLFVRWVDQGAKHAETPANAPSEARTPTPGTPRPTNGTPKPEGPKPATPAPLSAAEAHQMILTEFRKAATVARLDAIATRARQKFDFTPLQEGEQSDAYHAATDRIEGKTPIPTRMIARETIPF